MSDDVTSPHILPIDAILDAVSDTASNTAPDPEALTILGRSREGRPLRGLRVGHGETAVSLIAGCHADEPIGPATLDRLAAHLLALDDDAPLRSRFSWSIVPHVNPDGEARNAAWTDTLGDPSTWTRTDPPVRVDLPTYLRHVVREPPGDDVEFGFPRNARQPEKDDGARPENRAVAAFLRAGVERHGPFALHGSLHGMAFAAGPWFLLERSWADRTSALRASLRRAVVDLGYAVHDIDRGGEKGFHRLDEGFTSRPDSRAMAAHFEALGDVATARLFRPSSMELVRTLSGRARDGDPSGDEGDTLTFVTEMPLFLVPKEHFASHPLRPPAVAALRTAVDADEVRRRAEKAGIVAMPIVDQMRVQLLFLDACLRTVV